jgi:hypothetical protein
MLMKKIQKLPLMVTLHPEEPYPSLLAPSPTLLFQFLQGLGVVDMGLPASQKIEIRTIQNTVSLSLHYTSSSS